MIKKRLLISIACAAALTPSLAATSADAAETAQTADAQCAQDVSPYRDFDFLIGEWDFVMANGQKVADHTYTKRESGCLIVEDWRTLSGDTGLSIKYVDPQTGRWRSVWMSASFHIDYAGEKRDDGAMVLEGRMFPNNETGKGIINGRVIPDDDGKTARVRGVWTPLDDGSVAQEFLIYNFEQDAWESFFAGVDRPKSARETQ